MSELNSTSTSRRDFIKQTGTLAAASAFAGMAVPYVHAAESSTLQVALVGCGGRGTDAAGNALSVKGGGTKLIAIGDVFPERLPAHDEAIKKGICGKVDVVEDPK